MLGGPLGREKPQGAEPVRLRRFGDDRLGWSLRNRLSDRRRGRQAPFAHLVKVAGIGGKIDELNRIVVELATDGRREAHEGRLSVVHVPQSLAKIGDLGNVEVLRLLGVVVIEDAGFFIGGHEYVDIAFICEFLSGHPVISLEHFDLIMLRIVRRKDFAVGVNRLFFHHQAPPGGLTIWLRDFALLTNGLSSRIVLPIQRDHSPTFEP